MLCGVTATLGSNPSATATAARPHWGRAVLLCLACMCGVLVAPLVFRVPEGPAVGPGCLVCPWAVARPRAVRAASCARRVASKPGQASCLEAFPILSFACNSLTPAVRHLVKSPEFQRLHFKA